MDQRLKKAKQLLGLVEDEYEIATATFRRMASVKLDQHQADAYFAQVFPDPAASNEASSRLAADRKAMGHALLPRGAGRLIRQSS